MKVPIMRLILVLFLSVHTAIGADRSRPLLKDFIGLNGHFHFRPELYNQVCRLARNYHNMMWDVNRPGERPTFPVCVNKVNWKDHVYGRWIKAGIEVDICAQFGGFGPENVDYHRLWEGRPSWAYTYGYEMARYFGPSGPERLCTSIEIGNEPGNGFEDDLFKDIFKNMAKGIRAADPKVKILTPAVQVGPADKYSKSLQETFASPEMKGLYDVINLHVYAFKPKQEGRSPWDRSFPEDPAIDYLKTVDKAIAWRDREAPDKGIWITEFGWDACTDTAMKDRSGWFLNLNWTGVTELQQAQYLVRSLLCFSKRRIDRAYIYYYDDEDKASVHASSGLTRHFKPKMSFWAVKHLYETLGKFRFNRVVREVQDDLYVYEFIHGGNANEVIWAVWSPTGVGREKELTLQGLPSKPFRVEQMSIQQAPAPDVTWTTAGDGGIRLKVTESPVYVMMKE
jgi:hypothetical protein